MGYGRVDFQFDFGKSILFAVESNFRRVRGYCRQRYRGDDQGRDFWFSRTRFLNHRCVFLSPEILHFTITATTLPMTHAFLYDKYSEKCQEKE